jgi:hypothetical protein
MTGGCRRFLTRSTCSLRPNTSTGRGPAGKEGVNAGVHQDSVLPVIESGQAEIVDGEGAVGDRLMLHPTPGQTVGHVAIKLRSGSSVGTLCFSRCRCSVPTGIARFAKIRCEPGTRAVGCLSTRPRRCLGFNSRNERLRNGCLWRKADIRETTRLSLT